MRGGQTAKNGLVAIHILCAEDPGVSLAKPGHVFCTQFFFATLQFACSPKHDAQIIYQGSKPDK
jgi:hypothetical protein